MLTMYDDYGNYIEQDHPINYVVWAVLIVGAAFMMYLLIKNNRINSKKKDNKK